MAMVPYLMMEPAMPTPLPDPDRSISYSTKPASGFPQAGETNEEGNLESLGEGTNDRCANLSFFLSDENATLELAQRLAAQLKPGMVIYLHGDLGAGKTTLVRGVLNALGYTGRVKSPTYTLVEPYHASGLDLRHFDLYRLHDEEEWEAAGFRDEFDERNIFFIEWPEKAQGLIPQADVGIVFEILTKGRKLEIHAYTEKGKQCLIQL
jgi:tRNA threonylcarbamoyladenosine biosynthesis protein TsaE